MSLKIPVICSPVIAFGEHIHIDTGLYTYTHIYIHMVLSTFTVGSSLKGTHSNMLPDQLWGQKLGSLLEGRCVDDAAHHLRQSTLGGVGLLRLSQLCWSRSNLSGSQSLGFYCFPHEGLKTTQRKWHVFSSIPLLLLGICFYTKINCCIIVICFFNRLLC